MPESSGTEDQEGDPQEDPRRDSAGGGATADHLADLRRFDTPQDDPSDSGARGDVPEDAVPAPRAADDGGTGHAQSPRAPQPHPGWAYPAARREPLLADLRSEPPAPVRTATLGAALATGLLSMLLLGDGLALNLLIIAVPAALGAYFAGRRADRGPRPWTLAWAIGGLALLVVPALRDAGWPSFLAIVSAVALGSLALHGCRTWIGVLLAPLGIFDGVLTGVRWGWRGLRERSGGSRSGPVLRAVAVTAVLLLVFGALFAGADAAFAGLLGDLIPDASLSGGPWRVLLLVLGVVGALAVAHTAAAPVRWDRLVVGPGRARSRVEWALPLIVLNLLFAVFNVVQLAVLFGGYDAVLEKTDLSYSQYARQGFWQLLIATLLTLAVIVVALRWAPRDGAGDRSLVRAVLGTLCALTLVVVASAVRRMDMYVDAYGLTRLRVSVVGMELWLGLVIVLIMAAGVWGTRWLPRAVAASAAAGVLAFGLLSPDGLIAERNVQRYQETGKFDLEYARGLSADAAPAVDELPEPMRSCALEGIADGLGAERSPWYATSLGESRARQILDDGPLKADWRVCEQAGQETSYR
ncbi:DUF4173 domain-containing protein [Streptomyces sp. NBC_01381]|uniref:DUF4153 domain-containing protein n=1 Tax=Streptomyces sp. NBC_01381 TaxID=2903845 RepID=UPI0022529DFF|nr:DUF4173 domain-containing protein [Streptomyces sp. NBC_01381]MCX4670504.1 DUF4173 domain-containing protein [Streptomyces sp. NBC_01381]